MVQPWHLPLLFGTGLVAGFVDSVAGGGGLITLPVLMNLGIDPKLALGTNKLQATFGSGSASWHYARAGTVSPSDCKLGFAVTFLGAASRDSEPASKESLWVTAKHSSGIRDEY